MVVKSKGIHPKMALKNQVKDFYIPLFSHQKIGESTQKVAPKIAHENMLRFSWWVTQEAECLEECIQLRGSGQWFSTTPSCTATWLSAGEHKGWKGKKAGKERELCIQKPRWWFQISFVFIQTWGNHPIWRAYFSNGLVQPPTRKRSTKDMLTSFESHEICRWLGC